MKVAVVGATGLVGTVMLEVLEERNFPVTELLPVASDRSVGKDVTFNGRIYKVISLQDAVNARPDVAIFSAGGSVSLEWAPKFAEVGTTVIDNSSAWRMDPAKKLVVPEVNAEVYNLERKGFSPKQDEMAYHYQISENCIPHCDVFLENDYTKEEMKLVHETRKILSDDSLKITATAVRVPVNGGHSESVNIEFEKPFEVEVVKKILQESPGIVLMDDISKNIYPMPLLAKNKDDVFVGRIRRDESIENGLNLWIVSDNLRKGAATNAVQIAEYLAAKRWIGEKELV